MSLIYAAVFVHYLLFFDQGTQVRRKFIAGNWKMHKTAAESLQLAKLIRIKLNDIRKTTVALCPTFTGLQAVAEAVKGSEIALGGQNIYWETEGAFTGEVSGGMLKSVGCTYVIVGHSERRQYFWENDEVVQKKIVAALNAGLKPIVCVGETLSERERGVTENVISRQVKAALSGFTEEEMRKITIAYEPVWAIGTGKTATPGQAESVHEFIREILFSLYDNNVSENMIIQYGGSVKPQNAAELLSQANIDGALVGGASLKADDFADIVLAAEKL